MNSEAEKHMALTKDKKAIIVKELADLLASSKMTVVAKYEGTTVKAMQELRRQCEENGTTVKVVKNRLVVKALESTDSHKNSDTSDLQGMLMYAFNSTDEVAPAQVLHNMAKTEQQIEFVGAYDAEGNKLTADEVKALAQLPSKEVMIATVINTLMSPVNNVMSSLKGNLHGLLDAVAASKA
ncbi:MAG: large subunit ribosomal protein L10 [Candidatus Saccharimonadales bacterium]